MDPPKRPYYSHPQLSLDRLSDGNDVLAAALIRIRDFYLAGAPPVDVDRVLAEVEVALETAARVKYGF